MKVYLHLSIYSILSSSCSEPAFCAFIVPAAACTFPLWCSFLCIVSITVNSFPSFCKLTLLIYRMCFWLWHVPWPIGWRRPNLCLKGFWSLCWSWVWTTTVSHSCYFSSTTGYTHQKLEVQLFWWNRLVNAIYFFWEQIFPCGDKGLI